MQILTTMEMAEADRLTIAGGVSGFELMQAAGEAVAVAAVDLAEEGPILVVCGRGNNGGDGFIAASILVERGHDVRVMLLCDRATLTGDAALAAARWQGPLLPFDPQAIGEPALIVDAIFGAGLNRPPKGDPRTMIEAINASGLPVLAVDLPSGVNGDTGMVMDVAVQAQETMTFFRRKPGHLLLPGRLRCGRVRVADIGISEMVLEAIRPQTAENDPDLWAASVPVPQINGHKYARGHAVIVSGSMTTTGAARLAARAALRGGAGLVTVASPTDALPVHAASLTAVMLRATESVDEFAAMLADKRLNAFVIGPGAGVTDRTRSFVRAIVNAKRAVVLDADALTSFADAPENLFSLLKSAPEVAAVLTPHEGEFSRLFSVMDNKAPLKSKLERVRDAALRAGAVVLLKGPDTVVASPNGRAAIASNAPPWLATAGAGDVLAGLIGALLAQGVPAFEAACMAVWMHGEAGSEAGPGLIAEDLPEVLPAVTRRLYDAIGMDY
jgi:hydroxyethylthiazole kinase-like uncharacterized protein yjeF